MKMTIDCLRPALCLAALLTASPFLEAQDEQTGPPLPLSRELTLEREYSPSVQDANKVNTLPEVKEPAATQIPIDYAFLDGPAEPGREAGSLPAGRFLADMSYNKRRGYLNLGLGSYWNINADAGYHILDNDKDRLNLFLAHRSTDGQVTYADGFMKGEKVRARFNDNLGGIGYRHSFPQAALSLGAKFERSAFNYYGMPAPSMYSAWPNIAVVDAETNQQSQTLRANAGLESRSEEPVGYRLNLDYTRFSYKYAWDNSMPGITEQAAGAEMDLHKTFRADRRIGVAARLDAFFYALPEGASATFDNYAELTLTPYYRVEGDAWNLKLGLNAMFVTARHDDKMQAFLSPNATLDIKAGSATAVYLKAGGDVRSNSAYQLSRENRYIDPYLSVAPSRTRLDAAAGLRSSLLPGFRFHFFGRYKQTADDYFFIPHQSSEGFGNFSRVLPWDSKLLQLGAELRFAYLEWVELSLKAVHNSWNEEEEEADDRLATADDYPLAPKRKAYGRPANELTAGLSVRPAPKIALALHYYLASGRTTLLYNYNEAMKDVSELNFTGSYTFNDAFGAYLKLNNLLFKQYEFTYGYPLQGFNLMAGLNLNF